MAELDILAATRNTLRTPYAFTRVAIQYLESRLNGAVLADPTNPLLQQLEISSAQACIHIEESMASDRRRYLALSRKMSDLYLHASDYDMITRFSQPGHVDINILFPKELAIDSMVEDSVTRMRKLVIPRNSYVIADELPLISLYPIEIRQPVHRGVSSKNAPISIVYNTDKKSPIQSLDDNIVDWGILRDATGREYINMTLRMLQLARTQKIDSIEGDTYTFSLPYNDLFHYTRVFFRRNGVWYPFVVSFNDYVYDKRTPTIIVRVVEGVVDFRIPPVYINNGSVAQGTAIRFDIYTTKGNVSKDLSVVKAGSYSISYPNDDDEPSLEPYAAPLRSLECSVFSTGILTGGVNGSSFEQLYKLISDNANGIETPITPAQMEARLSLMGYDVIKNRDDLTDRIFLASKMMAASPTSQFGSSMSSGVLPLETTIDDIVQYPGIYDNNLRVTISPKTLFKLNSGMLSLVPADAYPDRAANTTENLINLINAGSYLFSPFHYVLDTTENNFDLRAYYLENPKQVSREFIHENETTQLEVSTKSFDLVRTATGYRLTIVTMVGENFQALTPDQFFCQLGFKPYMENNYAYQNGLHKGRFTKDNVTYDCWEFDFRTNFDLDSNDNLIVSNFSIYTSDTRSLEMPLSGDFILTYSVNNYFIDGLDYSEVDGYLGKQLLPLDVYGISAEKVGLVFGTALRNFWANRRALGGNVPIKTYSEDILAFWPEDVYEIDPVTKEKIFTIVDGKPVFNLLHRKNDPVLLADGKTQKIAHYKGDPIRDEYGQVQPISKRPVLRLIELFLVDGVYYYSNDQRAKDDLLYVPNAIVNTYIKEIDSLAKRRLDKTSIYFYPKKTIGNISVLIDDGVNVSMNAQLSFAIRVFATETGYTDTEFKAGFESMVTETIRNALRKRTVSSSSIISMINSNTDERICGFELKITAEGKPLTTATMVDDSYRATIRRLVALADDGKITINEDIKFEWDKHLESV